MTARLIAVDPFDLVVFGGTGDLAFRKLLPALFYRFRDGQIPAASRIVAASRRALTDEEYRSEARAALYRHVPEGDRDEPALAAFLALLSYLPLDAHSAAGWDRLHQALPAAGRVRVFYLAVAPDLFGPLSERIGAAGLVTPESRVVIEKPIGRDLASARAINDAVGAIFAERQIYRIDHYLGKETVQNLMALRFGNALFEPLWNAEHIDHVEITVAETLGVEGRGGYYDRAGALRDIVQNHLLQLLCLVALEPPAAFEADAVRDEKVKVLRALEPIDARTVATAAVRGQYHAGTSGGAEVPGYAEEIGSTGTSTETFVALRAEIGNWRWAGVPFYLRTGKRLPERLSEIAVVFRSVPHSIFGDAAGPIQRNRLVLRLQPDEAVMLWVMIKDPGPGGMRLRTVPLDMSFADTFRARAPDAYERLLLDVVRGSQTLFMRRDEVEAAWAWIDPIAAAWAESRTPPEPYAAGSWGPDAASALIERDGRTWKDDP